MGDQGVAGVMVDDDHLEQVLGQAGLDAQIAQPQARARADAGMLEDAAITRHQAGSQDADRLVERKIPRLDRIDDADRLIADHAALSVGAVCALLIGQRVRPVRCGVVHDRRADLDLGQAVLQQLAGLARHQGGQVAGLVAQPAGDRLQHLCPL